ncbi:8646_t:CDS:2 [Acaulospora morrowiae]|uniref:8646_t:CDS:1 n=1 Tax=Acaulospora morrowiae TaxID=94023 RepID=A0A9N8VD44_9GLOM|nr:8646_t:CDS:2 [Acaulospora morrowiae]
MLLVRTHEFPEIKPSTTYPEKLPHSDHMIWGSSVIGLNLRLDNSNGNHRMPFLKPEKLMKLFMRPFHGLLGTTKRAKIICREKKQPSALEFRRTSKDGMNDVIDIAKIRNTLPEKKQQRTALPF